MQVPGPSLDTRAKRMIFALQTRSCVSKSHKNRGVVYQKRGILQCHRNQPGTADGAFFTSNEDSSIENNEDPSMIL